MASVAAILDKYGLSDRFDAKKVLLKMGGRRPGKHCVGKAGGKGSYISAEKKCASHKGTFGELTEAGKASAVELADKVRKRKGMAAIEKAPPLVHRSLKIYERKFQGLYQYDEELKDEHANRDRITSNLAKRVSASGTKALAKVNADIAKTERRIESAKIQIRQTDIGGKQVRITSAGKDPDGSTTATFSMAGRERGSIAHATIRFHDGEVEHLPPATITGEIFNVDKAVSDHIKANAKESKDFADFVSRAVASHNSPVDPNLIEEIRTVPSLFNGVPYVDESALQRAAEVRAATAKTRRKNSTDRRDSQQNRTDTMDFDFVTATLEKYGLAHLDAKKVLLKMGGRRPGKHCVGKAGGKGSYIAAEKKCAAHKGADGKLTQAGKSSAGELAVRVRHMKGMPEKYEVKFARRSLAENLAPVKGTPMEKKLTASITKEHKESRSELNKRRINGGRAAFVDKKAPRTTKASDRPEAKTPTKTAVGVAPISEARNMNTETHRPSTGSRIGATTAKQPVSQLADGSLMMRNHSERQAKKQARVFFPQGFDLNAVPESWAGKKYVPAHWLAKPKP